MLCGYFVVAGTYLQSAATHDPLACEVMSPDGGLSGLLPFPVLSGHKVAVVSPWFEAGTATP